MARRRRHPKPDAAPDLSTGLTGTALLLVETPVEVLDLHGHTAEGAERRLRFFLERHRVTSGGRVVHVITGKGTGSAGAAVLPPLVRDLLAGDLAAAVSGVAGLPGGGGFAVRIAER
jgi:DNA-nicking Smr family endonuclease